MNYLEVVILGVVQGLTEFLPVSSTGHLILTAKLLKLTETNFLKSFEIAIQSGAIFAVLFLYGRRILADGRIILRVLVAFIPTALVGFFFYRQIKTLLGNSEVVLVALGVGGLVMIILEHFYKESEVIYHDIAHLPFGRVILIGLAQCFAFIPGVSRSATTIWAGLISGISRETIVEFSFLLAVPTLGAATAYEASKNFSLFTPDQFNLLGLGFVVSATVAFWSMRWLINFVSRSSFTAFGLYRLILVLVFWLMLY